MDYKKKTFYILLIPALLLIIGAILAVNGFFDSRPWWQREKVLDQILSDSKYQAPITDGDTFLFGNTSKEFLDSLSAKPQVHNKIDGKQSITILQKDFYQGLKIVTAFGDLELVPNKNNQPSQIIEGQIYKNSVVYATEDKLVAYLYNKEENELKEFVAMAKFDPAELYSPVGGQGKKEGLAYQWQMLNSTDYRLAYEQGAIAFYGPAPQYAKEPEFPKNFLYFKIPAPLVIKNSKLKIKNSPEAFWEVSGDILSLKVQLDDEAIKQYSNKLLVIDPSIEIGAKKADPAKQVKDEHTQKLIRDNGMDPDYVELAQDYSKRLTPAGKAQKNNDNSRKNDPDPSPYSRTYRDNQTGKYIAEVGGLPMVDNDGFAIDVGWQQQGNKFVEKNNLFKATVIGDNVELVIKNDQPDGRKKNDRLSFRPQLFLNGVEQTASGPTLLAIDPVNPNYQDNVLEWDYGVAKRRLRLIEGNVLGSWVFASNPNGEVRIKYNQIGDYKLRLGQFANGVDEELVPASVFDPAAHPFTVSDSATYNPDANPETTSVDGEVGHVNDGGLTWANLIAAAGNNPADSTTSFNVIYIGLGTSPNYVNLARGIFLFDTSGLADNAVVSAATLSPYGNDKYRSNVGLDPNINIYTSTPASNTALASGDFTQLGSVAQSTAITYTDWSTAGYNDFALNDMTKINLTGVSKFGTRNANYDVVASAPPHTGTNHAVQVKSYAAEQGAGYKPKLVVTYTVPATWQPRPGGVQPSGGAFLMF